MSGFQSKIIAMQIQQCSGRPCILCGKTANGAGVFIPNDEFAAKVGKPKNTIRIFAYPLCSRCRKKHKDWTSKVEAVILKDHLSMNHNAQN